MSRLSRPPELVAVGQSYGGRPLDAWPYVPTHVIIGRDDPFFPADWLSGVVRDRLGFEPDVLACGHTPALSRPRELVELMESYQASD